MRIAPAFALCAVLLAPAVAPASPQECENLAREIERFEDMAERAGDHGNPQWEARMNDQVDVLEERQAQRCSEADLIASSNECQDLTARINHYEEMATRAESLGNPRWAAQAREIADLLAEERSERCPEWSPQAQANRAFLRMLKTAGQMALTYFTMGVY
jgi:hypothetical protein